MSAPRKRSLEAAGQTVVTYSMKALAQEFFTENQQANEHATKAKHARKSLFSEMTEAAVTTFTFLATMGTRLAVEIGPGRNSSEVDMKRLRKLVNDDEKLLSLCTMTKTDVVANFGSIVADSVCLTKPGSVNVQVSVAK